MDPQWRERLGGAGGKGGDSTTEHGSRVGGDRGFTLVEVLVTVALIGIAFVALLGGLWTSIFGSDLHRKQAVADTVLTAAAERIKDTTHIPCAPLASYDGALTGITLPAGWTVAANIKVTEIKYFDGDPDGDGDFFGTTCYDTAAQGHRLTDQLITVTVTAPDSRTARTLAFVKGART